MKHVDLIVKAPHFYAMDDEGVGYRTGVCLVVDGGKIVEFCSEEVADATYSAEEVLNLDHHAVFPGFIDGHMHAQLNVLRGLAQDTNNWMMYGLQPFNNAITEEDGKAGAYVAFIEAIKAGTTTLGAQESELDSVAEFLTKVGARGNLTLTFRAAKHRVYHPGELYEFDDAMGEAGLKENIRLYNKWHDRGNIKILFGPQGPDFISPEMLVQTQKAVKERNTKLHLHTQQGDRETYQIVERYGKRPVAFLDDLGILDESLIAIHLTDCEDDEARQVAKSGASMVVNPGSIGIIDGVVCPSVVFQEAGGYVALGSDQAPGNNCHNIINEMKNVCLFNKIKYANPEVMPAWKALRMATIEGAKAVGIGDLVGSLEPGKQADFIAVDLNVPSMLPVFTHPMRNIVPNLVYSARGVEVTHSVVAGQIIMRDRTLVNIEEEAYLEDVKHRPEPIGRKAEEEFYAIDGTNARFMREGKL